MADQSQNQGTPRTSTQYSNWSQPMNWSYGSYNATPQMYNMSAFYAAQCYNQQGYQQFPNQQLNCNYKSFVHGGTLETSATTAPKSGPAQNSPPLPNGPAPSQPLPPQFDSDDLDKLPPLPPGSPPPVSVICDVPLPPQPNLLSLPPMPQTKNGRKKWRKKQRNLMEAMGAMTNKSPQIISQIPHLYTNLNFVSPVPNLQTPPPPKPVVNTSYTFTPIVPSIPPIQQIKPAEITNIQKKQNSFDLPDNCPTSLREYIQKCQDKCVNKIDRDRMDIILKGKVTNANHDGSLWIKDWTIEPMPMLLSENIPINQNQENGKNKNSIIKIAFKKSTNNYVKCYFTSKFKSGLSCASPSSTNESNIDMNKQKNSPLRENKKQNTDDFIPLKTSNEENNNKKMKYTTKNKKLYNEDAHLYQQYGTIDNKPKCDKNLLTKRAARFSSQGNPKKKPRQMLKFDNHSPKSITNNDIEFYIDSCHVVGTCTDLEKKYLRLTAAPDADAVRPLRILVKSLQHVKSKWINDSNYLFTCDQLKSIRQDLTVQGIRDSFTVEVYETHARIALEKSDMGEFNQCQTQLSDLYEELKDNPSAQKHRNEFLCYNILYCIYTRALCELNNIILYIKEFNIKDECIDFALNVKDTWWLSNHVELFSLYKIAPKMASYLMDMFLARERNNFFLAIAKSYRPTIPISTIQDQMAFDKREDCLAFLKAAGAVLTSNNENIDCKASCGSTEA